MFQINLSLPSFILKKKRSFYCRESYFQQLSRVSKVTGSDERKVSYEYDAMGRATKVVDGDAVTLYTYTATGRLKSVVDALGNETAYTYDSLDNLQSIHRAEGRISEEEKKDDYIPTVGKDGHVTLYTYNLAGQLTKITDALGQEETYEYDQYGRLLTKTDRDNYKTSYTYNKLGAVTNVGYSDGRNVAFAYNELNQLNEINDWLGKTVLENDSLGRLTKVTDYQNRTVSYEYGPLGEKTKLTYPDGRTAAYTYDAEGRLSGITGNGEKTSYTYDELGRLTEKLLPNGVKQAYSYLPGGNLKSMESFDKEGVLDKYFYTYDNAGLINGIDRNRRGLDKVSGQYAYKYDALGRLTESSLNGNTKSAYQYDAFGNRTSLVEDEVKTTYTYDALDRLVETNELNNSQAIKKTYDYDKRGNQTKEYVNGLLNKTFTFDATNMLSKVVDVNKGELENQYNGIGVRVASSCSEEKIEYLCDLSRDYYNLLERTVNGEKESFIYDINVVSMSKAENSYYYLQDELGSPMYLTGTDGVAINSYAFDDFGRNIDPFTGKQNRYGYTKQGNIIQPFAFTGYQEDEVSGLKFAQARFYNAENGRFIGEDQVKGFKESPKTLNHYSYCLNEPIEHKDENGRFVHIIAGALVGAVVGAGTSIITGVITGDMPSPGAIAASAVGGAVTGGVVAAFPGAAVLAPTIGGALGTVVTDGLTNLWGTKEEKKSIGEIAIDAGISAGVGAAFGALNKAKVGEKILNKITKNINSDKIRSGIRGLVGGEWRGITNEAAGSWQQNVKDAVRGARSVNGFLGFSGKTWKKALSCALLGELNAYSVVENAAEEGINYGKDNMIENSKKKKKSSSNIQTSVGSNGEEDCGENK